MLCSMLYNAHCTVSSSMYPIIAFGVFKLTLCAYAFLQSSDWSFLCDEYCPICKQKQWAQKQLGNVYCNSHSVNYNSHLHLFCIWKKGSLDNNSGMRRPSPSVTSCTVVFITATLFVSSLARFSLLLVLLNPCPLSFCLTRSRQRVTKLGPIRGLKSPKLI